MLKFLAAVAAFTLLAASATAQTAAPNRAPPGLMEKTYPALYAAAPSVRPMVVADARHFIMLDQPKAFADALDAFLAKP